MHFTVSEKTRFNHIILIYLVSILHNVFGRYDYLIFENFEMTKTNFIREQYIVRDLIEDRRVMSDILHILIRLWDIHRAMRMQTRGAAKYLICKLCPLIQPDSPEFGKTIVSYGKHIEKISTKRSGRWYDFDFQNNLSFYYFCMTLTFTFHVNL